MSSRNTQKQKAKRKAKKKEQRRTQESATRKEAAGFFFAEAQWHWSQGHLEKSLEVLRRVLKREPENVDALRLLTQLGIEANDLDLELEGVQRLFRAGLLADKDLPMLCDLLARTSHYEEALVVSAQLLEQLPQIQIRNKRVIRTEIKQLRAFCEQMVAVSGIEVSKPAPVKTAGKNKRSIQTMGDSGVETIVDETARPTIAPQPPVSEARVWESVPVSFDIDLGSFQSGLTAGVNADWLHYEVALEGHRIQFRDAFENLICLSQLNHIRSLWYQEETARKVMKRFRGRALLSDEVGLGKTIEAGIVLKEYIQRGMVRSAMILTPTPLVSQWKEELQSKFALDFISTDDTDFRKRGAAFWDAPWILASINQAKSARNFDKVVGREFDMVIVDEAHHLKNRTTVNWKLVNALQKRFLLLLTATPVENNLMELYNLITLLKPGQLKTATAFREEFMTKGDPTSPQNRVRLKDLLGQVMIRNTRALAKLNIPPRFAQTIRIEPTATEKKWYDEVNALTMVLHQSGGAKLLVESLLAEAGSSPRAVGVTLERMLAKQALAPDHLEHVRRLNALSNSLGKTGKNEMVLKLLRANKEKMLVFVKYMGTLAHVSDFLTAHKIAHAVFHGRMDNAAKDRNIEDFKNDKQVLVTTEIGGEGRNLQFCHQMINYDLPWNPMKIEQRIGRLHRIGQTSEVQIYNLCAAGSIEDYILEILDRKINMFEMVIGEIDMVLGRVKGEKDFSEMVVDIWLQNATEEERRQGFDDLGRRLKHSKSQYETTRSLDETLFGENYEL